MFIKFYRNYIFYLVLFLIVNTYFIKNYTFAQNADDFSLPTSNVTDETSSETHATIDSTTDTSTTESSLNQTQDLPNENISATADEVETVEILANKFKFSPPKESKDPFKPLIVKKVILPPPPPPSAQKPSGPPTPPPPPPPKPIHIFVSGICGNDNERLAMIKFENKDYIVTKDMVVDGKFKVIDILPDRVIIYSNKEQMRRTFTIGGGKD